MNLNIHLLFSVYLTDLTLKGKNYYVVGSRSQNKVDQFLSSIHSIYDLGLATQDFYIELDKNYLKYWGIIVDRINQLFPNAKIYSNRLDSYSKWFKAAHSVPLSSKLVLLQANHDHPYINSDKSFFWDFAKEISEFDNYVIGQITHWPENVALSQNREWITKKNIGLLQHTVNHAIGTTLVSRDFFISWWEKDFTMGHKIVRPDNPFGPSVPLKNILELTPSTELFRHLDGYGHVGVPPGVAGAFRSCCTIDNMKIVHTDWDYGDFHLGQNGELPDIPKLTKSNESIKIINLVLLASAYRVCFKNIYRIINYNSNKFKIIYFFFVLFQCLRNREFRVLVFQKILPIRRGNSTLWHLRLKMTEYLNFDIFAYLMSLTKISK